MQKIDIPCVIFAGGKSSRMGKDKATLFFKNQTLIEYQYKRLKKIFQKVYISTKYKKFDFEAPLIVDNSEIFAPIVAFENIFKKFDTFFAISVDTPFIDEEIIKKLIDSYQKNKNAHAVIAKTDFEHPLIGIYQNSIFENIKKEIENKNFKLRYILKISNTVFVEFKDSKKFFNINYPDDYKIAIKLSFD